MTRDETSSWVTFLGPIWRQVLLKGGLEEQQPVEMVLAGQGGDSAHCPRSPGHTVTTAHLFMAPGVYYLPRPEHMVHTFLPV